MSYPRCAPLSQGHRGVDRSVRGEDALQVLIGDALGKVEQEEFAWLFPAEEPLPRWSRIIHGVVLHGAWMMQKGLGGKHHGRTGLYRLVVHDGVRWLLTPLAIHLTMGTGWTGVARES